MSPTRLYVLLAATAVACAPDSASKTVGATAEVTPATGPQSGQAELSVTLPAGTRTEGLVDVFLDGERSLRGLGVSVAGNTLVLTEQGSPAAGPVDLRLVYDDGTERVFTDAYTYIPALDPVFSRMAAFGASITQGVQGSVPTARGLRVSPAAWLARQSGGFVPLPVLVDPLFPTIEPADIGPAPTCAVPSLSDFLGDAALDVVASLSNADGLDLSLGRQDPDLPPWHVAVGGTKVVDLVDGPAGSDLTAQFLARLVYAPHTPLEEELPGSQLDMLVDAAPSLVLSADMAGNDVILPLTEAGPIDLDLLTPPEVVAQELARSIDVLASSGAEVFLGTLPRPSLLPLARDKARRLVADGADEAEVQAVFDSVDAIAADNNAALVAEAARHANVHVVHLDDVTEALVQNGVQVGTQTLYPGKLGGLISTDGVHFSDTGYAITANAFIAVINEELGTDVPLVDLAAVAADDPYHPDALRAAGLEPDACD